MIDINDNVVLIQIHSSGPSLPKIVRNLVPEIFIAHLGLGAHLPTGIYKISLLKQVQEDLEMRSYICSTAKQLTLEFFNFKHSFDNMFYTFYNLHPFDTIEI